MEKGEIWPPTVSKTPKPMATKFGMNYEVGDPYPCAKFHHDPIRGFRSVPRRAGERIQGNLAS